MRTILSLSAIVVLLAGCSTTPKQTWYRGNTHTHTFWSDGNHFPEMAAAWYKTNGYQFVVLTDHNLRPTENTWVDLSKKKTVTSDPVEALRRTFGKDAVVTKEDEGGGKVLHRMLSYDEVARLVNVTNEFVAVPGEELTARVHMSAINTAHTLGVDRSIQDSMASAKDGAARVRLHEQEQQRPVFLQLNHPNWQYEMTAEVLAATLDAEAFELINPHCHNQGDEASPSTERLWDIAATLRLKKYGAAPIWAVASDDTHNYHDFEDLPDKANPGRAFVMVQGEELTGNSIATALKDGAFYSSTGVQLKTVFFDAESRVLTIEVDPSDPGMDFEIQFIGTPKDVLTASEPAAGFEYTKKVPLRENGKVVKKDGKRVLVEKRMVRAVTNTYSDQIGTVLKTVSGKKRAAYKVPDEMLYVRCKVTDLSHAGFVWGNETVSRAAWTQPVAWARSLERPSL